MPSDDAKAVKKEDEKSLSCMLESRKKKPTNGKVKKEEPKDEDDDDDFQKPLKKAAPRSKVKKEHNVIYDDDDDHKPISFKNSSASTKADSKVFLFALFFSKNYFCLFEKWRELLRIGEKPLSSAHSSFTGYLILENFI